MPKTDGLKGEHRTLSWLRMKGVRDVQKMRYLCPYNAIVGGKRVEIITANPSSQKGCGLIWRFNIHRHGRAIRHFADVFILRLEGIPGRPTQALHLVVPSEKIKTKVVGVSFLSLAEGKWAPYANNLNLLTAIP